MERMLLCLNSKKTYTVYLVGTIHNLASAWNSIKAGTIANCLWRCNLGELAAGCEEEEAVQVSSDNDCLPDSVSGALSRGRHNFRELCGGRYRFRNLCHIN